MKDGKWVYSGNEEMFSSDPVDTKGEAIAKMKVEMKEDDYEKGYVGQIKLFTPSVSADLVCEQLGEAACDQCGESADEWLVHANKADLEQLGESLTEVFNAWAKEHGHEPHFYRVINCEDVYLKEKK